MVLADFERFLAPYSEMSVLNKSRDEKGIYQFLGKNGKVIAVAAYFHEDNRLSVMTLPSRIQLSGKIPKTKMPPPQPVVAETVILNTERLLNSGYRGLWAPENKRALG